MAKSKINRILLGQAVSYSFFDFWSVTSSVSVRIDCGVPTALEGKRDMKRASSPTSLNVIGDIGRATADPSSPGLAGTPKLPRTPLQWSAGLAGLKTLNYYKC